MSSDETNESLWVSILDVKYVKPAFQKHKLEWPLAKFAIQQQTAPPDWPIALIHAHQPLGNQECSIISRKFLRRYLVDKNKRSSKIQLRFLTERYAVQPIDAKLFDAWNSKTKHGQLMPKSFYLTKASFVSDVLYAKFRLDGLYTQRLISKGQFLGLYNGPRYSEKEWNRIVTTSGCDKFRLNKTSRFSYVFSIPKSKTNPRGFVIDGMEGGYMRYINTACLGEEHAINTVYIPCFDQKNQIVVAVYALRDILPGQELLTWYSNDFVFTRYDLQLILEGIDTSPLVLLSRAQTQKWKYTELKTAFEMNRANPLTSKPLGLSGLKRRRTRGRPHKKIKMAKE